MFEIGVGEELVCIRGYYEWLDCWIFVEFILFVLLSLEVCMSFKFLEVWYGVLFVKIRVLVFFLVKYFSIVVMDESVCLMWRSFGVYGGGF